MTMRKTCFAYKETPVPKHPEYSTADCTALKEMLCANGMECPFYKPKEQWGTEMIKTHGKRDLEKVCRAYARTHKEVLG